MIQVINEQMHKQMKWQNSYVLVYYLKVFVNVYTKKDISNTYDMLSYLLLRNYVYTCIFTCTQRTYMYMYK